MRIRSDVASYSLWFRLATAGHVGAWLLSILFVMGGGLMLLVVALGGFHDSVGPVVLVDVLSGRAALSATLVVVIPAALVVIGILLPVLLRLARLPAWSRYKSWVERPPFSISGWREFVRAMETARRDGIPCVHLRMRLSWAAEPPHEARRLCDRLVADANLWCARWRSDGRRDGPADWSVEEPGVLLGEAHPQIARLLLRFLVEDLSRVARSQGAELAVQIEVIEARSLRPAEIGA